MNKAHPASTDIFKVQHQFFVKHLNISFLSVKVVLVWTMHTLTKRFNLEWSLKDFLSQRGDQNRVVADVCIYPQDQLQRDQLYQDQLQQDPHQRRQLQQQLFQQQQEENQGDQVQGQHEVSIYPDLNYSRIVATEVCLSALCLELYLKIRKEIC